MKFKNYLLLLLLITASIAKQTPLFANDKKATIKGSVISGEDNTPIAFATVFIKETTLAVITDQQGEYTLSIPSGSHTLSVAYMGFETYIQEITVKSNESKTLNISLQPSLLSIDEVVVRGESNSSLLNKTAYNVQSISLAGLKNSSASISNALSKMGGIKIRESGGVGSESNISLNGFTGNHVKIFIDGIQLDGNNKSFSLSNMPANFAERIDVYSGVVPIEFGTDAIGGVINIITNKDLRYRSLSIDASYSYGSFNTHSSYFNIDQVFENGFTYSINAYQNYSDNNYSIDNKVVIYTEIPGIGLSQTTDNKIYNVERFHDSYHNESAIISAGVANKKWADILILKFNYSQYDNEVQTGVIQDIVYGEKTRTGHSITPTLEYSKMGLIEGLDVRISANYSNGYTHNYDPGEYTYNWFGDKVANSSLSTQDSETKNNSWNTNFVTKYEISEKHDITLSHTYSSLSRLTRSLESGTSAYGAWDLPQESIKNISGLSYRYNPNEKLDFTAFAKYYNQTNKGYSYSTSTDLYEWSSKRDESLGYGTAASYFIVEGLQMKLSYEKAYRLPTATEIFGDLDLEIGTIALNPETSHNYNFNLSYRKEYGKHNIYLDGSLIRRFTLDYIRRSVSSDGSYASYENHGKVETKGYSITARYNFSNILSVGGTYNNLAARNAEEKIHSNTSYQDITYGLRMPNTPYKYANADATINFYDVMWKDDSFSLIYDLFYQHEFPLYWETLGSATTKTTVPTQLAHNVGINYSLQNGKYNISLEAKNLTDENLYDNYSLQKAGRAFYLKLRVNIIKTNSIQ